MDDDDSVYRIPGTLSSDISRHGASLFSTDVAAATVDGVRCPLQRRQPCQERRRCGNISPATEQRAEDRQASRRGAIDLQGAARRPEWILFR